MRRRDFVAGSAGLLTALGGRAFAQPAGSDADIERAIATMRESDTHTQSLDLETSAAQAWLYGIMLIENARTRAASLRVTPANTLRHARMLTTPASQGVTTPNNDTLYSTAWLDLTGGIVTLEVPRTGDRYISYHFMDMYGNSFAIRGTREDKGEAKSFRIIGPGGSRNGGDVIQSPTPWVWLLVRTLVDDAADLPAAHAVQDAIKLSGPPGPARPAPPEYATRDAPWDQFFTSLQKLIVENPPPRADDSFFPSIAALGLGRNGGFDAAKLAGSERVIQSGIDNAKAAASAQGAWGPVRGGWSYPQSNNGDFGTDYLFRARIAIGGLAALKPVEAMYMRPIGPGGQAVLDSSKPWILRFTREQLPPVNSFWSLTSYAQTPAGQFFFFPNPINRYAIGDRTKGLRYGTDGSLEIVISRTNPGGTRAANWLPAPPMAPLGLFFRAYLPKPELLDGRYSLPALVQG